MASIRKKEIAEIEKKLSRLQAVILFSSTRSNNIPFAQSTQNTENNWKTQFLRKPINELEYLRYKKILLGKICPNDTTEDSSLLLSMQQAQSSLKKAKNLTIALEDEPDKLLSTLRRGIDRCSLHLSDLVDLQQTKSYSRETTKREFEESAQSHRLPHKEPDHFKLPLTESMVENLPDYFTNGSNPSERNERKSATGPVSRNSIKTQRSSSTARFSKKDSPRKADQGLQRLIEAQNRKKRSLEESFARLMVERGQLLEDIQRLEQMKANLNPAAGMDKIIAIFDSEEVSVGDADLTFMQGGGFESDNQPPQHYQWSYSTCRKATESKENEIDLSLKDTTDLIQSYANPKKPELPHVRIFDDGCE